MTHSASIANPVIRLLGPLDFGNLQRPFARSWSAELVAYLHLHPLGASSDVWATALWPERRMAPSTLHSIASDARASLGRSITGVDHLPHSRGRLQLNATVTSDWTRLRALTQSADPKAWTRALSLVRGRPLLGLRSSEWALMEGVQTEMEQAIGRLALRAGEEALARGEPGHAVWSARQGLRASPLDEALFRLLLRAADLEGDPARVEGVMGELVCLLSDGLADPSEGSPPRCGPAQLALVHPETSGLYGRISRRKRCQREPEASGVPIRL